MTSSSSSSSFSSSSSSLPPSLTDHADFQGYSSYDISDLVKQFFRELSEPLLTVRFSELLLAVQESE